MNVIPGKSQDQDNVALPDRVLPNLFCNQFIPVFFAFIINFIDGQMLIAAKCISFLVLGTQAYFAIGDTLDVEKVPHRNIIRGKVLATRATGKG